MKRSKKIKEKQYLLQVTATFVMVGEGLQVVQKNLEHQLSGLNIIEFKIHSGQALIPQIGKEDIPQYAETN